jgi:hypothetical protein
MSFAVSSVALSASGAVSGAIGSYWSAQNTKITLEGQAALADINARISELGAQQELINGQQQVGQLTMRAGQVKGAQRAAMAANGIDLGVGNAAEVQASTDIMKEIDKNTVESNAVRSAWGFRTQGMNFQNEAIMKRGTAGGISPGMQGFSSLLTGASQVAGNWYSMNKAGSFNSPSNGGSFSASGSQGSVPGYSAGDLGSGLRIG